MFLLDQIFPLRSFWTTKSMNHSKFKWGHVCLTFLVSFVHSSWNLYISLIIITINTSLELLSTLIPFSTKFTFNIVETNHTLLISRKMNIKIEHMKAIVPTSCLCFTIGTLSTIIGALWCNDTSFSCLGFFFFLNCIDISAKFRLALMTIFSCCVAPNDLSFLNECECTIYSIPSLNKWYWLCSLWYKWWRVPYTWHGWWLRHFN